MLGLAQNMLRAQPPNKRFLLDKIKGAVAVYGLMKLKASAEKAIRVRRGSDSAELDIGFIGSGLDTATLLSFCGTADGYITKWYDQNNTGKDLIQTTASYQPKIVSAGALTQGVKNDGADDYLTSNQSQLTPYFATSNWAIMLVINPDGIGANPQELMIGLWHQPRLYYNTQLHQVTFCGITGRVYTMFCPTPNESVPINAETNVIIQATGTKYQVFINGVLQSETDYRPIDSGATDLWFGSAGPNTTFSGYYKDIIMFDRALTQAEISKLQGE